MTDDSGPRHTLGGFIRERRLLRLTLRELASLSKVSNAYISQVERGLHQPSVRVLRAIADALELSSKQLMAYVGTAGTSGAGEPAAPARPTDTERAIAADNRLSTEDPRQGRKDLPCPAGSAAAVGQ